MTDRGLPIADGAPACPFVAFEDDRDERATSPDHRHRCYAETTPAPRALAHQQAYCLSSAFPVCPTFQDWARREAAAARAQAPRAPIAPGQDRDRAAAIDGGPDDGPRRNPPRDWSAPPPWAGGPPPGLGSADDEEPDAPGFLMGRNRPEQGLAGSAADRVAMSATGPADSDSVGGPESARRHDAEFMGGAAAGAAAMSSGTGPGADASARSAGVAPPPRDAGPASGPGNPVGAPAELDYDDEFDDDFADQLASEQRRGAGNDDRRPDGGGRLGRDRRPRVGDSRGSRPVPGAAAPSWESPRRYEAYPTLKTRVGMPSSRVAVGALLLVVAAVAFFLLPMLLLPRSSAPTGSAGGAVSPRASAAASVGAGPTVSAAATPVIYVVAPGDNLEKIRRKFNVTMEQLLAANPQIKNPDKIAIGDQITIPGPGSSAAPASSSAAP